MHAAHYSSLLPEVFRHKSTKVRVPQPKVVLVDFHGTISERRWEDKVIFPYVKQATESYLQNNWQHETVQRCLPGLRNESFEQRFRNRFEDAPVIDEEEDRIEPKFLATQVSDFLVWQMNSKKETHETQTIERLVWQDGLRRNKILTPIYEDVMPSVSEWRDKHKCAVYIISSLDADTLRLLFKNTSKGNLDQFVTDYVSTKTGDKLVSDVYIKFVERVRSSLGIKINNHASSPQPSSPVRSNPASSADNHFSNHTSDKSLSLRSSTAVKSPKMMSPGSSFESISKPILFLTDSGQEAKAASQAAGGHAIDCLLVNRPGNKRIRSYYLSQFQYIEKFDDIEFVK